MNNQISTLLLVSMPTFILVAVACAIIGAVVGYFILKLLANKKYINVKNQADKLLENANNEAKALRKEAELELKEQRYKLKSEFEREVRDRKTEITRTEQRLQQKEDILNKKEDSLLKKDAEIEEIEKEFSYREQEIASKEKAVESQFDSMMKELERVSNMTKEEAKSTLVKKMEDEAKQDALALVRNIEANAKEEGTKKAKNILSLAIQKCSVDMVSETTVSVVALPDDMKGRIIGRDGRNIRAFENIKGIDLVVDDTPDVVVLSGFDPVRREIARISLEKLIVDGRIHPARIEELVQKAEKEVEVEIKEAGEKAMFDCGLFGIHPELIKTLGKLKYRTSYGQNVLKHSVEVAYIAGALAAELGVNVNLAKRAGLLHDIGKAIDREKEGTHVKLGVDIAEQYKESPEVINAIGSHHGDIEPTCIESILVQAADAISGARLGARRDSVENYKKRLEDLENIANAFEGVEKSFAIQAGREVRVIVKPEKVDDASTIFLAKDIARKIEQELRYPGQIKVNVIREIRTVDYAK